MLPTTPQGGQLPVESWASADRLVSAAWKVYEDLDRRVRPGINDRTSYLVGSLATFKRNVERFSEQTERLKHGPPFQSDNVLIDYVRWGEQFEGWAKSIDKTADFGSTWSMWREVGRGMVADAAKIAKDVGDATIGALKIAPFAILIVVLVVVFRRASK